MTPDCDISSIDPEQLIEKYTELIYKIMNRYKFVLQRTGAFDEEDLLQAGRIGLLQAQRHYDKTAGSSFISYATLWIKSNIRRAAGIDNDGNIPPELESLDKPANEEQPDGETLMDLIPDPTSKDNAERFADESEQNEMRIDLNKAIERLPGQIHRAVITKYYFNDEPTAKIAEELDLSPQTINERRRTGLSRLRADYHLRKYIPTFRVGRNTFQSTHTSVVEKNILWRERELESKFGEGAFFAF